jgi:16S rRNA (cytidine1402-2'-O)-methyltransferase
LPTDSFVYLGFLPKKASVRRKLLQDLAQESRTLVAYESPHRTGETLGIISDVLGASRPVCIAREITKKFEEFWRGRAEDAAQRFSEENPRGEVTLIIGGRPSGDDTWDEARVLMALQAQREEGASLSRAAKTIAQISGWKKNEVYNLGLRNLDS